MDCRLSSDQSGQFRKMLVGEGTIAKLAIIFGCVIKQIVLIWQKKGGRKRDYYHLTFPLENDRMWKNVKAMIRKSICYWINGR